MMHEVYVLCNCNDVEHCRTELYVADVRIAATRAEAFERGVSIMIHMAGALVAMLKAMSAW